MIIKNISGIHLGSPSSFIFNKICNRMIHFCLRNIDTTITILTENLMNIIDIFISQLIFNILIILITCLDLLNNLALNSNFAVYFFKHLSIF